MSDKPKTFEDYRETGRMVQGWNVGSDEYPSDWKSGEKGWNAGRESRDAEVADLQAKLRQAQAACASIPKLLIRRNSTESEFDGRGWHCIYCGDARMVNDPEGLEHSPSCIVTQPNPGAHLLARLQAADELAEAVKTGDLTLINQAREKFEKLWEEK